MENKMQEKKPNNELREQDLVELLRTTNKLLEEANRKTGQMIALLVKMRNSDVIARKSLVKYEKIPDTEERNTAVKRDAEVNYNSEVVHKKMDSLELRRLVAKHLHELAIPPHIKGYQYLKEGISLAIEEPEILNSITKAFYPRLASKFKTTRSGIERDIRHAIESSFDRVNYEVIIKYYGEGIDHEKGKLTNAEFIFTVKECIEDEI